jgi:hypothetical protein
MSKLSALIDSAAMFWDSDIHMYAHSFKWCRLSMHMQSYDARSELSRESLVTRIVCVCIVYLQTTLKSVVDVLDIYYKYLY